MTSLQFECPETSRPLTAMSIDASDPEMRIAVHCPKCSQLHVFSAADAVDERAVALA